MQAVFNYVARRQRGSNLYLDSLHKELRQVSGQFLEKEEAVNISDHILCSTVPDSCDDLLLDSLTEQKLLQLTEIDCVRQQGPLMDVIDLRLYEELCQASDQFLERRKQ